MQFEHLRRRVASALKLLALPLLLAPLAAAQSKPALKFTGIPNQNTTELAEKYKPLASYLSAKLGIPVEYVPSADYNASVDAFKNGDVLLAWFGGYTGCQARAAVPGARAIACGKRDLRFRSYFIAHASSGLTPVHEFPQGLAGKKFTFGSASSTSGRLMPEYFLRHATRKSPKEFLGAEPSFSGSHDKTIELVQAGTFDAGVVDYTVFEKRLKERKVDPALVRIIWTTPEYADYNFTVHPQAEEVYGAGFSERLQKTLLAIAGEDLQLLAAVDRVEDGLVACTNETFENLRQTALEIGLLR